MARADLIGRLRASVHACNAQRMPGTAKLLNEAADALAQQADTLADTQRRIIEAAERRGYDRAVAEQQAGGCEREAVRLLAIARCPNEDCVDGGYYGQRGEPTQCQWCYERAAALRAADNAEPVSTPYTLAGNDGRDGVAVNDARPLVQQWLHEALKIELAMPHDQHHDYAGMSEAAYRLRKCAKELYGALTAALAGGSHD